MNRILLAGIVCLMVFCSYAQKSYIKGSVYDTAHQQYLGFSTVSLLQAKDSAIVSFTRADSTGKFSLMHPGKGKYVLAVSYVGYVPVWKSIKLTDQETYNLGKIIMTDIKALSEVTLNVKRAPVMINNDTIEFNTENFATQPNAVVEDLLKKLPGVTVDADGTVKVNGQTVNKVYVNGKEFFTGDPKMATRNLNADAVDKVQVFDKKSDQAMFTGIEDGNTEKALNIKLKKDRDNAVFGKVTAGGNGDDRFEGQTNMNRFKGDQQLSFIAMGNNTNKQGFGMMDVMNFTGEMGKMMKGAGGINIKTFTDGPESAGLPVLSNSQNGIAQTFAGGMNFNDTWNKKKTDFNGSFTTSNSQLNNTSETVTQYIEPIMNKDYISTSKNDQQQQRFNFSIDHAFDSFNSVKFVPSLTWQQQQQNSKGYYNTMTGNKIKLNDGADTSSSNSDAVQSSNTLLLRHKFRKKGRTFSLSSNFNYNNSNQDGKQYSRNSVDTFSVVIDSIINQSYTRNANTTTFGSNATYTEPLSKNSLLEFNGFYNTSTGKTNKITYDYKSGQGFAIPDSLLTNSFKSEYVYAGGGLNFRKSRSKFNYNIGFSVQSATLKSTNITLNTTIPQSFTDVLPNLSYQYKFSMFSNLKIEYSTAVQQPTTSQLQPVLSMNGLLNQSTGNPNLTRAYSHNLNFNYFGGDFFKQRMFFGFANASYTNNAIVNADSTLPNGGMKIMPVNTNGQWNVFANGGYGFYVRKIKSRIFVNLGATVNHNIGFINGEVNKIDNQTINPNITWNYSVDKVIDIQTSATLIFSKVQYSLQPMLNSNYQTQRYAIDIIKDLPKGFTLTSKFTYSVNNGLSAGYNSNIPLWNASLAKGFMKNKRAEIKLSILDILNQNTGVSRNSSQNYIEDTRYTVLKRYILLSFTYGLNKSGLKAGGPHPPGMNIRVEN